MEKACALACYLFVCLIAMVIVLYHAFRVVTEIRFSNHLLEAIALVALVLVGVFVTLTVIIALSVAVSECLRVRVCR